MAQDEFWDRVDQERRERQQREIDERIAWRESEQRRREEKAWQEEQRRLREQERDR